MSEDRAAIQEQYNKLCYLSFSSQQTAIDAISRLQIEFERLCRINQAKFLGDFVLCLKSWHSTSFGFEIKVTENETVASLSDKFRAFGELSKFCPINFIESDRVLINLSHFQNAESAMNACKFGQVAGIPRIEPRPQYNTVFVTRLNEMFRNPSVQSITVQAAEEIGARVRNWRDVLEATGLYRVTGGFVHCNHALLSLQAARHQPVDLSDHQQYPALLNSVSGTHSSVGWGRRDQAAGPSSSINAREQYSHPWSRAAQRDQPSLVQVETELHS